MRGHSTQFWNLAWSIFFIHNGGFLTTNKGRNVDIFLLLEHQLSESDVKKAVANGHTEHKSVTRVIIKKNIILPKRS